MELKLVNDILEKPCEPFNFENPPYDIAELNNALTLYRDENLGLGLAANQVGIPYRVISVKGMDTCMFNPKIVYSSVEEQLSEEGCLSFPGLIVKIKRAEYNVTGEAIHEKKIGQVITIKVDCTYDKR